MAASQLQQSSGAPSRRNQPASTRRPTVEQDGDSDEPAEGGASSSDVKFECPRPDGLFADPGE